MTTPVDPNPVDYDMPTGLPYHDYFSKYGPDSTQQLAPCGICGFGPEATVHHQPPPVPPPNDTTEQMLETMQISEEAKTKRGKHRYVSHHDMRGPGYGPGLCAACGRAESDPDHDGDNDLAEPSESNESQTALDAQLAAGNGTMVALFPHPDDAQQMALPGDDAEDAGDLHLTLAYLPQFPPEKLNDLHHVVGQWAANTQPVDARISGKGEFHPSAGSDGKPVTYASVDAPGLSEHRAKLFGRLKGGGLKPAEDHGFDPHMTLKYNSHDGQVPEHALRFGHVTVANGTQRTHFPLVGRDPAHELGYLQVMDRPLEDETSAIPGQPAEQTEHAFVTEVNGKTLLTAPAFVVPQHFEQAQSPNNFMKYMAGRFVGGEKANRNGAFWSLGDLEFGLPTVAHGPLNWLHEARHIFGTITSADLVNPTPQQAAEGVQPHIQAMSGMWAWVYPDEVAVVEQASDQGKLFYSMECVSNTVECVGEGGCGTETGYMNYIRAGAGSCQHMKQRAGAERRFKEPTFLGGAAVVPPVRPGWADANASVMKQAAAMAEKAYEDAGKPDLPASEWELLMSQLLVYAGVE